MSATDAALSAKRLAHLDTLMRTRYVDTGRLPGTLTLVYRRGVLAHTGMAGRIDIERNLPMREDAIFRIYSMTKPVTSVAFMTLVEEGRVALDDPVHRFIPEWAGLGVFASGTPSAWVKQAPAAPMRVVDLLRHTSGLTYGFQNRSNVDAGAVELGARHQLEPGDPARGPVPHRPDAEQPQRLGDVVAGGAHGRGPPDHQAHGLRVLAVVGDVAREQRVAERDADRPGVARRDRLGVD